MASQSTPPKSKRSKMNGTPSKPPAPQGETVAAAPPMDFKKIGIRVGIPIGIGWILAALIRHWVGFVVMGVITILAVGLLIFAIRMMKRTRKVQSLVQGAKTAEERKEAIEQLGKEFKKDDPAAIFAKAQLLMQEDPRAALTELESINLSKVMPNLADEARAQRGMIHLMLGETQPARRLVDAIDLARHQDQRSRGMVAAVMCEAWARTGQAGRAIEILKLFDLNDAQLADIKPGLLRAQVFAFAAVDDVKQARTAMHALAKIDPRIVAGFAQKGMHPLVLQEAKKILDRHGLLPRPQMKRPMR